MTNEKVSEKLPGWVESVWQSCSGTIYKLCEIKCMCSDDAKDLFQTVALKFCQNAERLVSKDYAFPWLLKVLQNAHCDMLTNRNSVRTVLSLKEPAEVYTAVSEEDSLFFNSQKDDLCDYDALLSQLRPLERMIVEMSYVGGLTCAEIGNILGLSENAVRKRRHAILEKIREKLLQEEQALSKFRNFTT